MSEPFNEETFGDIQNFPNIEIVNFSNTYTTNEIEIPYYPQEDHVNNVQMDIDDKNETIFNTFLSQINEKTTISELLTIEEDETFLFKKPTVKKQLKYLNEYIMINEIENKIIFLQIINQDYKELKDCFLKGYEYIILLLIRFEKGVPFYIIFKKINNEYHQFFLDCEIKNETLFCIEQSSINSLNNLNNNFLKDFKINNPDIRFSLQYNGINLNFNAKLFIINNLIKAIENPDGGYYYIINFLIYIIIILDTNTFNNDLFQYFFLKFITYRDENSSIIKNDSLYNHFKTKIVKYFELNKNSIISDEDDIDILLNNINNKNYYTSFLYELFDNKVPLYYRLPKNLWYFLMDINLKNIEINFEQKSDSITNDSIYNTILFNNKPINKNEIKDKSIEINNNINFKEIKKTIEIPIVLTPTYFLNYKQNTDYEKRLLKRQRSEKSEKEQLNENPPKKQKQQEQEPQKLINRPFFIDSKEQKNENKVFYVISSSSSPVQSMDIDKTEKEEEEKKESINLVHYSKNRIIIINDSDSEFENFKVIEDKNIEKDLDKNNKKKEVFLTNKPEVLKKNVINEITIKSSSKQQQPIIIQKNIKEFINYQSKIFINTNKEELRDLFNRIDKFSLAIKTQHFNLNTSLNQFFKESSNVEDFRKIYSFPDNLDNLLKNVESHSSMSFIFNMELKKSNITSSVQYLYKLLMFNSNDNHIKFVSKTFNLNKFYNYRTHSIVTLNDNSKEKIEIFNEIRIAYFLRILWIGFENILSPNFMIIFDWCKLKLFDDNPKIGLFQKILFKEKAVPKDDYFEFIICENIEFESKDFLQKFIINNHPFPLKLKILKIIIFQILHALETAYLTTGFVSNDLHLGNVMIKRVDDIKHKDFIYKRYKHSEKYYHLQEQIHQGYLVKIIDFGRSKIIPRLYNGNIPIFHEKEDLYILKNGDTKIDTKRILGSILFDLSFEFWDIDIKRRLYQEGTEIEVKKDYKLFLEFMEDSLQFNQWKETIKKDNKLLGEFNNIFNINKQNDFNIDNITLEIIMLDYNHQVLDEQTYKKVHHFFIYHFFFIKKHLNKDATEILNSDYFEDIIIKKEQIPKDSIFLSNPKDEWILK